jgi:hypothetical protein
VAWFGNTYFCLTFLSFLKTFWNWRNKPLPHTKNGILMLDIFKRHNMKISCALFLIAIRKEMQLTGWQM